MSYNVKGPPVVAAAKMPTVEETTSLPAIAISGFPAKMLCTRDDESKEAEMNETTMRKVSQINSQRVEKLLSTLH